MNETPTHLVDSVTASKLILGSSTKKYMEETIELDLRTSHSEHSTTVRKAMYIIETVLPKPHFFLV